MTGAAQPPSLFEILYLMATGWHDIASWVANVQMEVVQRCAMTRAAQPL